MGETTAQERTYSFAIVITVLVVGLLGGYWFGLTQGAKSGRAAEVVRA